MHHLFFQNSRQYIQPFCTILHNTFMVKIYQSFKFFAFHTGCSLGSVFFQVLSKIHNLCLSLTKYGSFEAKHIRICDLTEKKLRLVPKRQKYQPILNPLITSYLPGSLRKAKEYNSKDIIMEQPFLIKFINFDVI